MNKIKQNDEVIVISGKDKGSVGTVTKVMGSKLKIGRASCRERV